LILDENFCTKISACSFWEAEKAVDGPEIMKDMENMVEILVADDEPVVALAIKSALKFCGFSAFTVPDGVAALDQVQANPNRFSVVLTDHNMPGLGGIALVKALRAIGYPGGIVILSGYLTREYEAQYKMLGVDQILPKPFSIERLRLALNRALHPEVCPA
jgi:CheY-like chemotaxis protein